MIIIATGMNTMAMVVLKQSWLLQVWVEPSVIMTTVWKRPISGIEEEEKEGEKEEKEEEKEGEEGTTSITLTTSRILLDQG